VSQVPAQGLAIQPETQYHSGYYKCDAIEEVAVNPIDLTRITLNQRVMAGKPVIRGTRIPVDLIVRMVSQGISEEAILAEYPRLETADIRAALAYAAQVVADEDVFPLTLSA
jgi:uncharacterized protein (DUF433 family)